MQIERDQRKAGQQRAGEQIADGDGSRREVSLRELRRLVRVAELVAEQHQHGGGRENLRQRRGGGDGAGGKPRVVAEAQHRRQRDQAHGHRGGADDAFRGSKQRAHHDYRDAEPAAQRTEQPAHGLEQFLGDARALEHDAHEDEHRDRQQCLVGHHAENALR